MRELDERGLPEGYPLQVQLEMTPRQAAAALKREGSGFILIDCREPFELERARIEGTVDIPMGEVASRLSEIDADEETPIGVICHSGRRSLQVAMYLQEQGLRGARSVAGGIDLWSVDIDPSVPRYTK
jgi:rhodanese-related sulfurtransferase